MTKLSDLLSAVPTGWSDPDKVSAGELLLYIVVYPVAAGLVIAALVALPSLLKRK